MMDGNKAQLSHDRPATSLALEVFADAIGGMIAEWRRTPVATLGGYFCIDGRKCLATTSAIDGRNGRLAKAVTIAGVDQSTV
jgi:hypothetical protein